MSRRHTVNNLAIACLFYSDWENRTMQRVIASVCLPVLTWHTAQNREQRSCTATGEWDLRQLQGEWLVHIRAIAGRLHDAPSLTSCGLCSLSPSVLKTQKVGHGEMVWLREVAELYFSMVAELIGLRIRCRCHH